MDPTSSKLPGSPPGDCPVPSSERRPLSRALRMLVGGGALLLVLAGAGWWAARHWYRPGAGPGSEPAGIGASHEDPRRTYSGPFLNIYPDVAYVGDQKCAECHPGETRSFHQHPMGRSLLPISQIAARQRYDADAHNPFEALGTQFLVERRGEQMVHHQIGRDEKGQAVYDCAMPVDYVLGSGTRGYSYLLERDGYMFLSPVSWFSQQHIWDMSPGFSVAIRPGRVVVGECLFCHANRVRPMEGYVNRYEKPVFDGCAIGCERCHGPGGRHIEDPGRKDSATGADYTIVNPRYLEAKLRAAVCEQCHLTGEARVVHRGRHASDFRPGLPLEAFWSIYVRATDANEPRMAVSHVEQMYLSQCFRHSDDKPAGAALRGGPPHPGERSVLRDVAARKLGCTSCHDPHRHIGPEERVAHYRARCLACHQERGCLLPEDTRRKDKGDSCIDCHMPRYPPVDIAHTTATDHRILRWKDPLTPNPSPPRGEGRKSAPLSPGGRGGGGEGGILSFYGQGKGVRDEEAQRDLGMALAHVLVQKVNQRQASPAVVGRQAAGLLEAAVRDDPEDLAAREAQAQVLSLLGRREEALALYEAVLSRAPHREVSLMGAALLARKLQKVEPALSYWRRAVAENPWQPYYRASLAGMLADRKAWEEARPHSEAWLRLDPASVEARMLWVRCLLKTGDRAAAQAEFARIERLRPPNLPRLQARFTVEFRSR